MPVHGETTLHRHWDELFLFHIPDGFCLCSFLLASEGTDAHPFTDKPISSKPHGNLRGSWRCHHTPLQQGASLTTECVGDGKPGTGRRERLREAGLGRGAEASRAHATLLAHAAPHRRPTRQRVAVTLHLTAEEPQQHRELKIAPQGQARDRLMHTGVTRQTVPPGHTRVSHRSAQCKEKCARRFWFFPFTVSSLWSCWPFSQLVLMGGGGKKRGRIFKQDTQDRDYR